MLTVEEEDYAIAFKCIDLANNVFERISFAIWTGGESVSQDREWHSDGKQQLGTSCEFGMTVLAFMVSLELIYSGAKRV